MKVAPTHVILAVLVPFVGACAARHSREYEDRRLDSEPADAAPPQDASVALDAPALLDAELVHPSDAGRKSSLEQAWESADCVTSKLPAADERGEFFELCVEDKDGRLAEVRAALSPVADDVIYSETSEGIIDCERGVEWLVYSIPSDVPPKVLCDLTRLSYVEKIGWGVISI
jgi:hypothetical protein